MSLYHLQTILAHLCTNGALLKEFSSDPLAVLSRYELTEAEREQVLKANTFRLGAYTQMLRSKRLSHVKKLMPLTWKLVEPHMPALVDRYCQEYPLTPDHTNVVFKEATLFHAFLCRLIDEEEALNLPYVRDIVEYEMAKLQLAFSVEIAEATQQFRALAGATNPEEAAAHLDALYPLAGPHWRLLQFHYDIASVIRWLEGDDADEPPPAPGPCYLLLVKYVDGFLVRTIRVSPLVARLLFLCDGQQRATAIVDSEADGDHSLVDACRAALLALHKGEVIALIPTGGIP